MNIENLIMILAVAAIGIYALYLGKIEIVTGALGIMGGILTSTRKERRDEKTVPADPPPAG